MKTGILIMIVGAALIPGVSYSQGLDAVLQAKVDAQVKGIQELGRNPIVVQAVQAHNHSPSAEATAMTQDKWKSLTVLDPFVRSLTKNPLAEFLKVTRTDAVSEAFVSGMEGTKVAFLAKTSGWSHKGRPKHEVPMTGKVWQGAVEVDESTGLQQVQVGVPVLDGNKVIGSLVVGLSLSKLSKD